MAHFILVGGISFFVNLLLDVRKIKVRNYQFLLGSFLVFIFITFEEFSQMFLVRRKFDLLDLSANYLGIFLFGNLALWICNEFNILEKRIF